MAWICEFLCDLEESKSNNVLGKEGRGSFSQSNQRAGQKKEVRSDGVKQKGGRITNW